MEFDCEKLGDEMKLGRRAIIVPYRDAYFVNQIGFAVRDVQMIEELRRLNLFEQIVVLNRPVSIYERLLRKKNINKSKWPNIDTLDTTSYDIFGPLRKRLWLSNCYSDLISHAVDVINRDGRCKELFVIDFHPISIVNKIQLNGVRIVYWYDMIDNFYIHNRYSPDEKAAVLKKYVVVRDNYNCVTGVSYEALKQIGHRNSSLLTNGVFTSGEICSLYGKQIPVYDFGFVGFVTDKFDLDIVKKLISKGFSVVIHGSVLDKHVGDALRSIGAILGGVFNYSEIASRISQFKVGLLPYLLEKEHDGSPLKMYEYLKFNRPCLTSIDYEVDSRYVVNYKKSNDLDASLALLLGYSCNSEISKSIEENMFLSYKVSTFVSENLLGV